MLWGRGLWCRSPLCQDVLNHFSWSTVDSSPPHGATGQSLIWESGFVPSWMACTLSFHHLKKHLDGSFFKTPLKIDNHRFVLNVHARLWSSIRGEKKHERKWLIAFFSVGQLAGGVILGVALWLRHDSQTSNLLILQFEGHQAPGTFYISEYSPPTAGIHNHSSMFFSGSCKPTFWIWSLQTLAVQWHHHYRQPFVFKKNLKTTPFHICIYTSIQYNNQWAQVQTTNVRSSFLTHCNLHKVTNLSTSRSILYHNLASHLFP